MLKSVLPLSCAVLVAGWQAAAPPPIVGRWDLTIHTTGGDRAAWLEVQHSGLQTLVGRFVGTGGSARPVSRVEFKDGALRFAIPPQWERVDGDLVVTGRLEGDRLSGTMALAGGTPQSWTGVRAPSLRRSAPPRWGAAIRLLNGRDLQGWHATGNNQWEVAGGVLRSPRSGSNLVTDRTFEDFRLHGEFRYPKDSNSGIYLRGRYEVQIIDLDDEPTGVGSLGAVYGFLAPTRPAGRHAGEWQTLDVTLLGRLVSVVLNGQTIACDAEIPGVTGGALDSNEGEPGPLLLQGDHGPIEFRNLVVTPARQ